MLIGSFCDLLTNRLYINLPTHIGNKITKEINKILKEKKERKVNKE